MWTSFVFTCHGRAVPDNFQVLALVVVVPPSPRRPVHGTGPLLGLYVMTRYSGVTEGAFYLDLFLPPVI